MRSPRQAKQPLNLYTILAQDLSPAAAFLACESVPGQFEAVAVLLGLLTKHPDADRLEWTELVQCVSLCTAMVTLPDLTAFQLLVPKGWKILVCPLPLLAVQDAQSGAGIG